MIATLIALLAGIYLYINSVGADYASNLLLLGIALLVGSIFLVVVPVIRAFMWAPLQQGEYHLTPHVVEFYNKDHKLRITQFYLLLFPLLTFAIAILFLFFNNMDTRILLPVWLVLFGLAIDALQYSLKRGLRYFDPLHVASLFTREAKHSIQEDQELELTHWIDSLSEIALRALQRTSVSLCNQVCNELHQIMRIFLESSKSISHETVDKESRAVGIKDRVTYTLFFMLQRLELINNKAVEQRLEPVCSQLVSILGKIVIDSAKCDISLASYPIPFLGRFAVHAQRNGMPEVGSKATYTLLEVARTIVRDIDLTYLEIQEPFSILINQMSEISKESFRQNKSASISLLAQPFRDLKEIFKSEKMASHRDTNAILQQIDRMLGEFDALEAVMRAIPPMPGDLSESGLGA